MGRSCYVLLFSHVVSPRWSRLIRTITFRQSPAVLDRPMSSRGSRGNCYSENRWQSRSVTWRWCTMTPVYRVDTRGRLWIPRWYASISVTDDCLTVSPILSVYSFLSWQSLRVPFFSLDVSILGDGEQWPARVIPALSGSAIIIATLVADDLLCTEDNRKRLFFLNHRDDDIRFYLSRALLLAEFSRDPLFGIVLNWRQWFPLSFCFFFNRQISFLRLFLFRFANRSYLGLSESWSRGRSWNSMRQSARRIASEHQCERSRRHDGTTGRDRWRLIQIRSPRGGDGVVPETAAGTTPGAGQCVAISRPGSQPALPPWILLKNVAVSIETWCNQSLK